jgi:hypothetical protein
LRPPQRSGPSPSNLAATLVPPGNLSHGGICCDAQYANPQGCKVKLQFQTRAKTGAALGVKKASIIRPGAGPAKGWGPTGASGSSTARVQAGRLSVPRSAGHRKKPPTEAVQSVKGRRPLVLYEGRPYRRSLQLMSETTMSVVGIAVGSGVVLLLALAIIL